VSGSAPTPTVLPELGSSPEAPIPVAAVNAAVRELLESSLRPLWVVGEVTNWHRHTSGHCYFSLRGEDAQIRCVMFRSDAQRLPTDPEEGMEVCSLGRLTLYEARGTFQLVVKAIEARGEGLWRLAFERLKAKLTAEGLFDPVLKKSLPPVPRCVGVVTSRTGAALQDFVAVVRRRAPWTRVVVSDCRVQGAEAAEDIVAALARLVRYGGCEVIILTRGGGSVEDLWAFNDERLARAIAECPVPTVSAVGHEIDVTIADFVADVRAPTPSAAAENVVPDGTTLAADLRSFAAGLADGLRGMVQRQGEGLRLLTRCLLEAAERELTDKGTGLALLSGRLEALSPLATLERGYAVPVGTAGVVLRRGEMFGIGEPFRLRVVDANVDCRVERVVSLGEENAGSG
jgi:exodeoxyribonuclease VII large subunit